MKNAMFAIDDKTAIATKAVLQSCDIDNFRDAFNTAHELKRNIIGTSKGGRLRLDTPRNKKPTQVESKYKPRKPRKPSR